MFFFNYYEFIKVEDEIIVFFFRKKKLINVLIVFEIIRNFKVFKNVLLLVSLLVNYVV